MLKDIKLLLGIKDDSKDALLNLLKEQATQEALDYTHQNDVAKLKTSIIQMVVYKYNRLGTDGIDSEDYSGISFTYSADYPDTIMRSLKAQRRVRVL